MTKPSETIDKLQASIDDLTPLVDSLIAEVRVLREENANQKKMLADLFAEGGK